MKLANTNSLVLLIALLFLMMLTEIHSQQNSPINLINGNYIREWLLLGPFYSNDLEKDFLESAGGEANVNPNEGDIFITSKGDTLKWKFVQSKRIIVDLYPFNHSS